MKAVVLSSSFYALKMCVFSAIAILPVLLLKSKIEGIFSSGNRLFADGGFLLITALIFAAAGMLLLAVTRDEIVKSIISKLNRRIH